MKKIILFSLSILLLVAAVAFQHKPAAVKIKNTAQPFALIELFTSQGCSSCPAADKLLAQTIKKAKQNGSNIFALSFHVDYWNRLGWADPFSTSDFSQRQRDYAEQLNLSSVYTPQMIVNGNKEFVGSDESVLKEALKNSLANTPVVVFKSLTASLLNNAPPKINFSLDGNYPDCKINFALVSLSETTNIKRGENGGLTLTNENVVRQFISIPATATGQVYFKNSPMPAADNIAIVAYLQQNKDLKIIGATMAEINK